MIATGGRGAPTSWSRSMPGEVLPRWPRFVNGTRLGRSWYSCRAPTSTASSTATAKRPPRRWPPRIDSSACTTLWATTCRRGSDRSSALFTNPRSLCAPPGHPRDARSTSASSGICAKRRTLFEQRTPHDWLPPRRSSASSTLASRTTLRTSTKRASRWPPTRATSGAAKCHPGRCDAPSRAATQW